MAKKATTQHPDGTEETVVFGEIVPTSGQAPVSEDELFAVEAGTAVQAFLGGVRAFFQQATQLERSAKLTLQEAKALVLPTNGAEDEALQTFIKGTSVAAKAVEEHWDICQRVSAFHKRLTGARARSVDALKEANLLGNNLHNRYVAEAKRKAAEEQERVRKEAERKASEDRQKELDELERQANEAEAASATLSEREQIFVDMYFANGNAMKAAQVAGYKNPMEKGAALILLPKIKAAVEAKQSAAAIRSQAKAKSEAPLEVEVETVKADITRAAGVKGDVTTWGYEVLDEAAFIEAFRSGKYGVPTNCVQPAPKGLGELARGLRENLDRIPGLRHKKTTGVR